MIARYEVLLWNAASQKAETIEVSDESEMKLRASLSVQRPGCEIQRVKRLYGILNPTREWLSVQEACEYLGVVWDTLNKWVEAGLITKYGTADVPRFRVAELSAFLEGKQKRKAA